MYSPRSVVSARSIVRQDVRVHHSNYIARANCSRLDNAGIEAAHTPLVSAGSRIVKLELYTLPNRVEGPVRL